MGASDYITIIWRGGYIDIFGNHLKHPGVSGRIEREYLDDFCANSHGILADWLSHRIPRFHNLYGWYYVDIDEDN